jgi:Domain of unknown function (DUF4082)/Putative Ig domain
MNLETKWQINRTLSTTVNGAVEREYRVARAKHLARPIPAGSYGIRNQFFAYSSFNASTQTFSGTPAAANVGTLSVKASATDLGGLAASETFNIAVATAPTTMSLFTASNTPAQTNLNDGSRLEIGVKFTSSVAGQITALKFYRSASDTGSDLLHLWTSTGTKLGQRDLHQHRRKRLGVNRFTLG